MNTIEFLRGFRIGEYAIFDITVSFLGIWLLSPMLIRIFRLIKLDIPKRNFLFLTLPIGIITHVLLGQNTLMTKYFTDPSSHYLLKIFIISLFLFGLRGIRVIKKSKV